MSGRLAGKTAFITAAGQGIGHATAQAFAAEGAKVYATDVAAEKLTSLAKTAGITIRPLNALDPAAITQAAKDLGAVDVIFNCAGVVHNGTVLECTDEQWQLEIDLNERSMFRVIKAFLPAMLQ